MRCMTIVDDDDDGQRRGLLKRSNFQILNCVHLFIFLSAGHKINAKYPPCSCAVIHRAVIHRPIPPSRPVRCALSLSLSHTLCPFGRLIAVVIGWHTRLSTWHRNTRSSFEIILHWSSHWSVSPSKPSPPRLSQSKHHISFFLFPLLGRRSHLSIAPNSLVHHAANTHTHGTRVRNNNVSTNSQPPPTQPGSHPHRCEQWHQSHCPCGGAARLHADAAGRQPSPSSWYSRALITFRVCGRPRWPP